MKILFYSISIAAFFLGNFMAAHQAMAANVGVLRSDKDNLTLVTPDGTKTFYKDILYDGNYDIYERLMANKGKSSNTGNESEWSGDFLAQNDGLEYIITASGRVFIYNITGDEIDSFRISGNNKNYALGVGDILPNTNGQEVLVCAIKTRHARIKIFSYDESTGTATKQLSFTPFPDTVDENIDHGCSGLDVAKVDGKMKIITKQLNTINTNSILYIYNSDGELEKTMEFNDGYSYWGYNYIHSDIVDFTGDGSSDEIAISDYPGIAIYDLSSGEKLSSWDFSDYGYVDYSIGNIDDKTGDEIVIMYGKKSHMLIWNGDGTTDVGKLYPDATQNRNRKIVITDYSSIIK